MKKSRIAALVLLLSCVLGAVIVIGRAGHDAALMHPRKPPVRFDGPDQFAIPPQERKEAERSVIRLLRGYKHGNFEGSMEFQDGMLDPRYTYAGAELADAIRVDYPMFVGYHSITFDDTYKDARGPLVLHAVMTDGTSNPISASFVVDPADGQDDPYFIFDYGDDLVEPPSAVAFAGRPLYVDPELLVELQEASRQSVKS